MARFYAGESLAVNFEPAESTHRRILARIMIQRVALTPKNYNVISRGLQLFTIPELFVTKGEKPRSVL